MKTERETKSHALRPSQLHAKLRERFGFENLELMQGFAMAVAMYFVKNNDDAWQSKDVVGTDGLVSENTFLTLIRNYLPTLFNAEKLVELEREGFIFRTSQLVATFSVRPAFFVYCDERLEQKVPPETAKVVPSPEMDEAQQAVAPEVEVVQVPVMDIAEQIMAEARTTAALEPGQDFYIPSGYWSSGQRC